MYVQADNDNAYSRTRTGRANVMSFAVDPAIFPCQLSEGTTSAAKSAVKAAAAAWGERSLALLDAEDRLSVACEKGSTDDEVLLRLRAAYQVRGVRLVGSPASVEQTNKPLLLQACCG